MNIPIKKKYPYYIRRQDKDSFALAGIYSITRDYHITATIITKPASEMLGKIHNKKLRQPVILRKELEDEWLRNDLKEDHIKELINIPYHDDELVAYTVSNDIFKRNVPSNHPNIIEKFQYLELL